MDNESAQSIKDSYSNMKRVCSILRIVAMVLLAFLAIIDAAIIVISLAVATDGQAIVSAIYTLLHGVMMCTVLVLAILGLADVVKGKSPFTATQVRRFLIAGFIFLVIALVEVAFPVNLSFDLIPESNAYVAVDTITTSGTSNLDVAALLFSFASFCLSAIFKYGIILQQLSDETV